MHVRSRDSEGSIFLDCRLLFFDAADLAPSRAAVKHAGEFAKLGYRADGVDLDAPVVQVAGVARQPKFHRRPLCEVAVANSLHASADEPAFGVNCLAGRLGHSDKP